MERTWNVPKPLYKVQLWHQGVETLGSAITERKYFPAEVLLMGVLDSLSLSLSLSVCVCVCVWCVCVFWGCGFLGLLSIFRRWPWVWLIAGLRSAPRMILGRQESMVVDPCGCGYVWQTVDMCEPTPLYMYRGAYKCI